MFLTLIQAWGHLTLLNGHKWQGATHPPTCTLPPVIQLQDKHHILPLGLHHKHSSSVKLRKSTIFEKVKPLPRKRILLGFELFYCLYFTHVRLKILRASL